MIISILVLLPLISGMVAFIVRNNALRRSLLIAAALIHTALTLTAWVQMPAPIFGNWLFLDSLGLFFLTLTSVLFLASAVCAIGFLAREFPGKQEDIDEGELFINAPEARFVGCLLFFLATMTLVCAAHHFGILWVAVEATTLASAPLIYFHRHRRSLEATWKYLLVCSVGIAIALLGNFFLAEAISTGTGEKISTILSDLLTHASKFHLPWLRAAFLCFLVGYGTKMGLAPMHTWLPDAHSEAPSVVSALLSGALLNCAFLAILRIYQVCAAAGQKIFCQELLIGFGLLSMLIAAVFIIGQRDYKRMLAYSSVEHMGILTLGVGIGGAAQFGAILHALNHSFTKATLFLVAGNIIATYRTKVSAHVQGMLKSIPLSGILWIAGLFAITGSPPFGTFVSEFGILKGAIDSGRFAVAGIYLALLCVVFIGMSNVMLAMAQGVPAADSKIVARKEPLLSVLPPLVLVTAVLLLGFYIPTAVRHVIEQASQALGQF